MHSRAEPIDGESIGFDVPAGQMGRAFILPQRLLGLQLPSHLTVSQTSGAPLPEVVTFADPGEVDGVMESQHRQTV